MAKLIEEIKIEVLRKVHTWTLYKKPVKGTAGEQRAYEVGFRQRVQDFQQNTTRPKLVSGFRLLRERSAYEKGYTDALLQEGSR